MCGVPPHEQYVARFKGHFSDERLSRLHQIAPAHVAMFAWETKYIRKLLHPCVLYGICVVLVPRLLCHDTRVVKTLEHICGNGEDFLHQQDQKFACAVLVGCLCSERELTSLRAKTHVHAAQSLRLKIG